MRGLVTWLLVFGILAGLNARALAANGSRAAVCSHFVESCESGHHHGPADDHHHDRDCERDGKCPSEHHHHHDACFQVLPLAIENDRAGSLAEPVASRLDHRSNGESPPEGPFLSLDKPPLV